MKPIYLNIIGKVLSVLAVIAFFPLIILVLLKVNVLFTSCAASLLILDIVLMFVAWDLQWRGNGDSVEST